jgi:hypothetical protein
MQKAAAMTMRHLLGMGMGISILASCGSKDSANDELLAPPAATEGFQLKLDVTAPAASETWACQVSSLPIDGPVGAHAVVHRVNRSTHHLTITLPLTAGVGLDEGMYDCNQLYADHPQLMEATELYGGQGDSAQLTLPDGVAAKLPGPMQILYEVHYVNSTADAVDLQARVNVYTVPIDTVKQGIWGTQMRNEKLNIPPHANKTEVSRCVVNKDTDVILLATHTHGLGKETKISTFDGHTVGAQVYGNLDWSRPELKQFDPPLHVTAGQGFDLSCSYFNGTDHTVSYGLKSTDEMCNLTMVFVPEDPTVKCGITYQSEDHPGTP